MLGRGLQHAHKGEWCARQVPFELPHASLVKTMAEDRLMGRIPASHTAAEEPDISKEGQFFHSQTVRRKCHWVELSQIEGACVLLEVMDS